MKKFILVLIFGMILSATVMADPAYNNAIENLINIKIQEYQKDQALINAYTAMMAAEKGQIASYQATLNTAGINWNGVNWSNPQVVNWATFPVK